MDLKRVNSKLVLSEVEQSRQSSRRERWGAVKGRQAAEMDWHEIKKFVESVDIRASAA